jgi:hypothetical protein
MSLWNKLIYSVELIIYEFGKLFINIRLVGNGYLWGQRDYRLHEV